MSYDKPNHDSASYKSWYQNADPREHTYSPGYGFSDKPPETLERSLITSYSTGIAISFFGFYLLKSIVPVISSWFISAFFRFSQSVDLQLHETTGQVSMLITSILALGIPFTLFRLFVKIPSSNAYPLKPIKRSTLAFITFIGLGASVVSYFATNAVVFAASFIGVKMSGGSIVLPSTPSAIFLFIINTTVIPAFLEEAIFRGLIMQTLRRFGDGFALVVSSILFALLHANIAQAPNAFIMGLVMGYFTLLTGSIWAGILIHFANNLSVIFLIFISNTLSPTATISVNYALYIFYIISGLVALLFLLRDYHNLFFIRQSNSYLTSREKISVFFTSPPMVVTVLTTMTIAIGQLGRV